MSAQHTPGPWKIDHFNTSTGCYQISGHEQVLNLAFVQDYSDEGDSDQEAKANARLIAAAPDLLEALKDLIASASPTEKEHPRMFAAWQQARAALTKAKGGNQ